MIFPLILGVILGAISVIFIAQNVSVVTVAFLTWQFEGSLAVVLLLTLVCGIVITLLFLLPSLIKDMFYLSAIEKQKKVAEEELADTKRVLADVAQLPRDSGPVIVTESPM